MKTLIIHPKDNSTSFLDIIYNHINDKTVITECLSKKELSELIKAHDRVMIMGHGSPLGLFNIGNTRSYGSYMIDESLVPDLSQKDNSIFIWCNADKFVEKHNLKGFYSGMFISEVEESLYCGLNGVDQNMVDESNFKFCELLSSVVEKDNREIHKIVTSGYRKLGIFNKVAYYNYNRLYIST